MTKEDGGFVVVQKRETRKKRGVFALKSIVFYGNYDWWGEPDSYPKIPA